MNDPLEADCALCQRPLMEHTVAELRAHTNVELPYEEIPGAPVVGTINTVMVTHLTCLAVVSQHETAAGLFKLPGIVFRFSTGDGETLPDITLLLDAPMVATLGKLVGDTAVAAAKAADQ